MILLTHYPGALTVAEYMRFSKAFDSIYYYSRSKVELTRMTRSLKACLRPRAVVAALPLSLAVTIGIDLGTTNSAVAVLKNGAPVLVPNRRGERSRGRRPAP